MNQYARNRESRMEDIFVDKFGCRLVEDTSRRTQGLGDKIFESTNGHLLVVDHKSTTGDKMITLKKEWMDKINKEAKRFHSQAMGLTTISFYGSSDMLVVMRLEDFELLIR